MKKYYLVALLFGATFAYPESSAFDAGNINNTSTYGLTQNEQIIKNRLDTLQNEYLQNSSKINSISERLDGLQSTLEGVNSQYAKTNSRLIYMEDKEANLSLELQTLKKQVNDLRKSQENNAKEIKKSLDEISKILQLKTSDINITIEDDNSSKELPVKEEKEVKKDDESWKKKSNDNILNLAMKDFKSKKTLNKAKDKFEYLLSKNYKPARSNFYLGEIEYKQKKYANAISYYKQSASLYSKADYMPTLLYHTAISLDKVGDTKSANSFYKALKSSYPNSPEAKASPNRK